MKKILLPLALMMLLLSAGISQSAITQVGSGQKNCVSGTTLTTSYSTTTGNPKALVFFVSWRAPSLIYTVSSAGWDGGSASHVSGALGNAANGTDIWVQTLGAHTGKSANYTVVLSTSVYFCTFVMEFDNIDQGTPFGGGTGVGADGLDFSPTLTVSGASGTDLVLDVFVYDNPDNDFGEVVTASVGASQTQKLNASQASTGSAGSQMLVSTQAAASGGAMTWSLSGETDAYRTYWGGSAFYLNEGVAATVKPFRNPVTLGN